jgi:hypothetical protein
MLAGILTVSFSLAGYKEMNHGGTNQLVLPPQ